MKRIAFLFLLTLSLTLAACDGDKKVEPTLAPLTPAQPTSAPLPTPTSAAQDSPLPPALQSPLATPAP